MKYKKLVCKKCGCKEIVIDLTVQVKYLETESGVRETETLGSDLAITGEPYCLECGAEL